jgi:hypothetical protein
VPGMACGGGGGEGGCRSTSISCVLPVLGGSEWLSEGLDRFVPVGRARCTNGAEGRLGPRADLGITPTEP